MTVEELMTQIRTLGERCRQRFIRLCEIQEASSGRLPSSDEMKELETLVDESHKDDLEVAKLKTLLETLLPDFTPTPRTFH